MNISVVVPVYNAEKTLEILAGRIRTALAPLASGFELVLVNDGSRDGSWAVIEKLAADNAWIRGICLMRNYGQHNALLAGIRAARFEITMTMDDDLQHPPEEIPRMLAKLAEGFDVVYGPPDQEQHGFLRDLASIITKIALQSAIGAETARVVSAWRVFRTRVRDAFQNYHSPFICIDVLLTWGTTNFSSVRIRHDPRTIGKSNYTFRKLVRHALTMMTGFSVVPLQIASVVGFAFTLFGIGVLAYVLARYLLAGGSVAGFPFLASIVAIFSGAQLFALGIFGEYLAQVHFRTMEKPTYVIRESFDGVESKRI